MQIKNMDIKSYIGELSSKSATPGGGSVSGISLVQGLALNMMVINLTIGNSKYKEMENLNKECLLQCKNLYEESLNAADEDKKSFEILAKAYKLPKNTEEEYNIKKYELDKASLGATKAPFRCMELALKGIEITDKLLYNSNKMAISDLGVAANMFLSATKSAWLNVKINIPYLEDKDLALQFKQNGIGILNKVKDLSDKIYKGVENEL